MGWQLSWLDLSDRWKDYFIRDLHNAAAMSKDENTKVGALIIDTEAKISLSSGWNDLSRGVEHKPERNQRPLKYYFTSHAERSCLDNALRTGVAVKGMTMLVSLGCCPQCACSVVNSGVVEVVSPDLDFTHHSCGHLYQYSQEIISEGGVGWVFDNRLKYV